MRRKENVFTYLESVFLGAYGCQKRRKVPQVHRRLRQRLLHYAGCGTGPAIAREELLDACVEISIVDIDKYETRDF